MRVGARGPWRAAAGALLLWTAGCGGEATAPSPTPVPGQPRSYALGFTDFPHARTLEAVEAALDVLGRDADLFVLHFDDGIPWDEALAGAPYPAGYQAWLDDRLRAIPSGHVRYLAVTPIAFERDRLAPRRGELASEPLQPPWDSRAFDDPAVVQAFTAHCLRMIAHFQPDYFAYGIEVNMLPFFSPEKEATFERLAAAVYASLKASHPSLPVFLTHQVDLLHAAPGEQAEVIRRLLPYTEVMAASSYPYTQDADPGALRGDHFSALAALAPDLPFVVAETGWPAEDVADPYPVVIPSSEENQRAYVERLLSDAESLSALFVCWFLTRDYDEFWEAEIRHAPDAATLRLWKDIGLYRGDGTPRPSLDSWRARLQRPRS